MQIYILRYIDMYDLPEEAQDVYKFLALEQGINNGEYYPWDIGKEDTNAISYIGLEKCRIIDSALLQAGFVTGDTIHILWAW